MNYFRTLAALSFFVAFAVLFFLVAWYVALPLLAVFIVVSFFGYLKDMVFPAKKHTHRVKPRTEHSDVIDVEYTEIKE
ncbi:MAG: hypothetical protein LBU87_04885 [Lactobacillales bacterium]|jgi:predicted membrane protein|nr:hypothetical protein [Lactobacillales bacterium]